LEWIVAQDIFENLLSSLTVEEMREQRAQYLKLINGYEARVSALTALIEIRESMDLREPGSGIRVGPAEPIVELAQRLARPSIPQAVLTVMETAPDSEWSTDDLYAALESRGWLPGGKTPRNSLQATVSRLVEDDKLERVGTGVVRFPAGQGRDASLLDQEGG
jgi:hypothetical protein